MHGQAAAPLLPVLHCRDGGVPAFGLYQHLPRGGVSGGRPCRHGGDRAGGGGNDEAAAAGVLSSGVRAGERDKIKAAAIITSPSRFATFENVCYLIQNGADRFSFIFFRGFGTGAMHVLCGLIVGGGLAYTWRRTWLKIAGTCGLLGAAITLHAIYNLLIAYGGAAQYIAYALPVLLVAAGKLSAFRLSQKK